MKSDIMAFNDEIERIRYGLMKTAKNPVVIDKKPKADAARTKTTIELPTNLFDE